MHHQHTVESRHANGATATHCPYCALQCAQYVTATKDGSSVTVDARDFPTNRGGMCQKGWSSADVLTANDRLTTPLIRQNGRLVPAHWDDALDLIHERLSDLKEQHGPDALAVFGGGGLTNEKAYTLGKFARIVLGTRFIDYNGRFCMSSAAAAANRSLGVDRGLTFPVSDLDDAEAIFIIGSNPAATMPPLVQHFATAREAGGLIVIDPRESATAMLTRDGQGVHLASIPGTDMVVLLALLHTLIDEDLIDHQYLAERTTGWDEVAVSVGRWWPERAEQLCGVSADQLRLTARRLAAASPAQGGKGLYVLTGRGMEQSTQGTNTVSAAINLSLALGLIGRDGSGYGPLTGQGNGQGGREHGLKSDQLPGYRMITDLQGREHVARVWGVNPEQIPGPGVPAVELLSRLGIDDGPRALMVHGANIVVSAPNVNSVQEALRRLDFLVVADVVPSETTEFADVILPVTQWAEEEGTMTSLEGRVIRRRQAINPPVGVRDELWIWGQLATRFGHPIVTNPADVFDELTRASAGGKADYSGISYNRLDTGDELYWPCTSSKPEGTPRLFRDRFPTSTGKAVMFAVDHQGPADDVTPTKPIHLITGRLLHHYQSGAQTRRVAQLVDAASAPTAELHPLLADTLGVVEGQKVKIASARGEITIAASITETIRPDTVFVPFHWAGDISANLLTNDAVDQVSSMPEFKVCAVTVRPVQEVAE